MNWFIRSGVLACAGVGGWVAGTYTERKKRINVEYVEEKSRYLPALPIFGVVSAAAPFDSSKDLVPSASHDNKGLVSAKEDKPFQLMKYGYPGYDCVMSQGDYILSYDRRNRVAHWVFEHLTADTIKPCGIDRSNCQFVEDTSVHPHFRSTNEDYKRSGFDRGHLAAAGNHKASEEKIQRTFVLSNIAPQVGEGFNRHSWNRLERYVRKLTQAYKHVYVCTGPLYLPRKEADGKTYVKYQVIGANSVAVPTHFFKVIVGEKADATLDMEAYVMPNEAISDETPLNVFQVPPDSIERAAGLLFFDKISLEKLKSINGRKPTQYKKK